VPAKKNIVREIQILSGIMILLIITLPVLIIPSPEDVAVETGENVVQEIEPLIKDTQYSFDFKLLYLAFLMLEVLLVLEPFLPSFRSLLCI
jgi:hypothetical protein